MCALLQIRFRGLVASRSSSTRRARRNWPKRRPGKYDAKDPALCGGADGGTSGDRRSTVLGLAEPRRLVDEVHHSRSYRPRGPAFRHADASYLSDLGGAMPALAASCVGPLVVHALLTDCVGVSPAERNITRLSAGARQERAQNAILSRLWCTLSVSPRSLPSEGPSTNPSRFCALPRFFTDPLRPVGTGGSSKPTPQR